MLYLHLPFCHHRCIYCNFFATASKSARVGFEDLILKELELRANFLDVNEVETIYFGGGTPSLMKPEQLEKLLDGVRSRFTLASDVEITLEANPEDMSQEYCHRWLDMGFNRLSIGVQSFHDEDLKWLGRIHNASKSHRGIETALEAGFQELSIDLIYGIPGQTIELWHQNLSSFKSYQIPHLSAYWLTVEPRTPLEKLLAKGGRQNPDEIEGEEHFIVLMEWAKEHGYEHYEISNLCLPGHYSKHNTAYWQGHPYLGLGPSAHSFRDGYRCWNPSSMVDYIDMIGRGNVTHEEETLSKADKFNEYIMLRLRTQWGCGMKEIYDLFGKVAEEHCRTIAKNYERQGMLITGNDMFFLTNQGKLQADGIASAFFLEDENLPFK